MCTTGGSSRGSRSADHGQQNGQAGRKEDHPAYVRVGYSIHSHEFSRPTFPALFSRNARAPRPNVTAGASHPERLKHIVRRAHESESRKDGRNSERVGFGAHWGGG